MHVCSTISAKNVKRQIQNIHQNVLALTPKAQATKEEIDKLNLFEIINFGDAKDIINKLKDSLPNERRYL